LKIRATTRAYAGRVTGQPEQDTRGILDPGQLLQHISLTRQPTPAPMADFVDRFWGVEWDVPEGERRSTEVLTHPGLNISVGHAPEHGPVEARVYGVARDLSVRVLVGSGWNVAAMTRPGGFGAFVGGSVAVLTDRVLPMGDVLDLDESRLVARMSRAADQVARTDILGEALVDVLARADPDRLAAARQITEVSRLAETERSLSRVDELAAATGTSVRTLQRLFRQHAGVSPLWVLRRYRLLDAAELVAGGRDVAWAEVALDLGYADQAHLIRDFRAATGKTPAAYAAAQRDPA